MEKKIYKNIVVNPDVMVGKPVIEGTRIPVDLIITLLAQGVSIEDIIEDYDLKKQDVKTILEYAAKVVQGESVFSI